MTLDNQVECERIETPHAMIGYCVEYNTERCNHSCNYAKDKDIHIMEKDRRVFRN